VGGRGLGIAHVLRYAHALKTGNGKFRLGTSANFTGEEHYAIATQTDNPIFEGSVYQALLDQRRAARDRWLLGAKPRCWYTQWYTDDIGTWWTTSGCRPKSCRACCAGGGTRPSSGRSVTAGSPAPTGVRLRADAAGAALIHDCVKAGWRAVPAMTADQPLWLARYGPGWRTRWW